MYNEESALQDIRACIEKVNEQLPAQERIGKEAGTVLAGQGSTLESLTLINLMVEIEEAVSANRKARISLLEGALMGKEGAQFTTIAELAKWIAAQA